MNRFFIFACLVLLFAPCSAFQITEFCPDPYLPDDTDEYLVLSGSGSLDGITISDGEGGFRFPPGTVIDGKVTVARSAAAFNISHGYLPDFEWYGTSPETPDVISGEKIRMANTRDELMVYQGGTVLQKVSWPADVKAREGQVHYLENGTWDKRPLFLGQSRFEPAVFHNVTVTAFVSPDSAAPVFSDAIASAEQYVYVNVYEFTRPSLAQNLVEAKERGADVLVLVEGGPVGGISPEEMSVLYALNQSGIPVNVMASAGNMKAPYRFDHAKYIIIDGRAVLVTSENFKGTGIPPSGYSGNRGWGVLCEDAGLAAYFERVFISDIRDDNSLPAQGTPGDTEWEPTTRFTPEFPAQRYYGAEVRPVLSPDTSYLILDLITGAGETIEIEQAYITNETATTLNPYLAAAINASRRGVRVRVLLDSYWYNTEDEKDNDEMAATINRIAAAENLPLEAKCAEIDLNNIEKIHNKGVIIDNRSVLISSINWNSNSPNFNRETGVIVRHFGVASYFKQVFEDDWQPKVPRAENRTDTTRYAVLALVILLLIVLYLFRRNRR
jgi:phosphatidylserine/phosphatidylglycerophosphate/cardiolipin synthase-like enzyme